MLASQPTLPYAMLLLMAGVSCLDMGICAGEFLAAVHVVARGGCMFVSGDGRRVDRVNPARARVLTDREVEVLKGLSSGRRYAQIAFELEISIDTVKKHGRSLLQKLAASSTRDFIGLPVEWLTWAAALQETKDMSLRTLRPREAG